MAGLDDAVLLLQAKNYSGSGDWLDESGNGHDGTISGATHLAYAGTQYLWLPQAATDYLTIPGNAAYAVTDTVEIEFSIALDTFAGGSQTVTWHGAWNSRGYRVLIGSSPASVTFTAMYSGGTDVEVLPQADAFPGGVGVRSWVKLVYEKAGGPAGVYRVTWYQKSSEGAAYSQVQQDDGAAVGGLTTPVAGDVYNVAGENGGTNPLGGKLFSYKATLDGDVELDIDLGDKTALTEPYATFTEKSVNAATVTINRAASGYVSTVVDRAMFLFDGVDDVVTVADHADLDFGATDDLSAIVVFRSHQTGTQAYLLNKNQAGPGWAIVYGGTYTSGIVDDGPNRVFDLTADITVRSLHTAAFVRNTTDDDLESFLDGAGTGSPATDTTTGTLANAGALQIGVSGGFWWQGAVVAAAVWREALTDAEILAAGEALLGAVPTITLLGA